MKVRAGRAELMFGGRVFGRKFARAVVDAHHERWKHFLAVGAGEGVDASGYAAMGQAGSERPWRPPAGWEAPRSSAAPDAEVGVVPAAPGIDHFT